MGAKPDVFQAINRPSVVEEIIDHFTQRLLRGELIPGQRLPSEPELTQQLGVGRSAVREAMKKLEALGVVDIQHGNGTYIVDKPSSTLLNPLVFAIMLEAGMGTELLELRALLQVGYCQVAAYKASVEDWERIEHAEKAFEAHAHAPHRDVETLAHLDLSFHYAILDATHNPLIIKIGRTVEELFFASIRTTLAKMTNLEWGIEGHRRIIQALRGGEPENIRQVVVDSLAHWGNEIGGSVEGMQ